MANVIIATAVLALMLASSIYSWIMCDKAGDGGAAWAVGFWASILGLILTAVWVSYGVWSTIHPIAGGCAGVVLLTLIFIGVKAATS